LAARARTVEIFGLGRYDRSQADQNGQTSVSPNIYTAYGLIFHSELRLPEMLPGSGAADVVICYGDVAEPQPGTADDQAYFRAAEDELLLHIPGIARYRVRNGNEIVIQRLPGSQLRDVRVYLLGSGLAALLHQRGVLALHAGAIRTAGGAVLFAGHSGSGKSTLLSAFLQRGYEMLSDDVCGVVFDADGNLLVLPGLPRSKLWADAAATLGIETAGLQRIYSRQNKYAIPLAGNFVAAPLPLSRIYVLAPRHGRSLTIEPLDGLDRVGALLEHTFREPFLTGLRQRENHLRLAAAVAERADFFVVGRPVTGSGPYETVDAIERSWKES
jgi:hypothetical protein